MDYDNAKKPRSDQQRRRRSRAVVLLLVLTNAASILVFSCAGAALHAHVSRRYPAVHAWGSSKLLRELNATGLALAASHAEVVDLSSRLSAANKQLEAILGGSAAKRDMEAAREEQREAAANGLWRQELPPGGELRLAVGPHRLPLGPSRRLGGASEMFPALGQACHRHRGELEQYMNYTAGGECPSDEAFAQRLMLKGCEPLPRRRCRPRTPAGYVEPAPLPASLWAIPPDTSIVWDAYTCKNYSCLVDRVRRGRPGSHDDCEACFDLAGKELRRWVGDGGGDLDYDIDTVLASKPRGTIRIGLDIGGGTGTFAARMRERNVTVVTTTLDLDAPFNRFVASRGLVPLQITLMQRLPFADGVLDIVHSMNALSNWVPNAVLEAALFDIYRVLRPGGVFWLDHFFCLGPQLNATYVPIFDRVGFRRLRWKAGRKLDLGAERNEWYVSALLEKPMT